MIDNRNTETFADAGEEKIAGLLSSLPSVSAPSDFNFRVRARIAKGRLVIKPSWAVRIGRVAVPTVLLVGVGGYFGTGMFTQPSTPTGINQAGMFPRPPVATSPQPVESQKPVVSEAPAPSQPEIKQPEIAKNPAKSATPANAVIPANKKVEAAPKPTRPAAGGSYEEAGNPTASITIPAMKKLANAGVQMSGTKVVAAPAGSGFKAGDQILNMTTPSSVTVRRDGKTVQIALK